MEPELPDNVDSQSRSETTERPTLPFAVVGIGASAGGLEAYSRMLRNLPGDTGMAYVLVQHLDPNHVSHLVDLIAKISPLPIREARDNERVLPDHVYVIPPNTLMTVKNGFLHLEPRPESRAAFMPVDFFFSSLAEDQRSQAIGIVLSGNGSDGTFGIKAIKGAGGISFAQDSSAAHEGMPRSAVNSECVDFVLPPESIAQELGRICRHPYVARRTPEVEFSMSEGDHDSLRALFQLLQQGTHVDYSKYKRTTILRRIQRRLMLHRLERLEDYVRFIEKHPDELSALDQDLLIHVTRFFRDPEAFDALTKTVFPRLFQDRPKDVPLRVWVPGCSTGEEVYSLVISLTEFSDHHANAAPIKVFATDVSELALQKARAGKYLENITADVSETQLQRFFLRNEVGFQVNKAIRDVCVFARHDMTQDPPFSNLDLISCRNVLIYLGPSLQKRVMSIFHYALKDSGFLLLGVSETIGALTELFNAIDTKLKIYSRKATPSRVMFDFISSEEPSRRPHDSGNGGDVVSGQALRREVDRALLAHYAPAGVLVNEDMEILQSRGQTSPFLALAPGSASLNLMKMAREGILLDVRSALEEAKQTAAPTRREGLRVRANGHYLKVNLQIFPVTIASQRYFIVLFENMTRPTAVEPADSPQDALLEANRETGGEVSQLQHELVSTKEYLQSIIDQLEGSNEELKAANEEILSSNEELQSTNEELQTAKEELQATNEELNTVNEELQSRNREATQLADDLTNLFRTIVIPIVIVGPDLRIRRYTPSAVGVFNFIPADAGRSIADLNSKLLDVDLKSHIQQVLDTLVTYENEVRDQEGRWHRIVIHPYRTRENRIEGAVVSIMDIDVLKRSEQAIKQARDYAENIIKTLHVPLLVLDAELRVVSANASFYEGFRTAAAASERRNVTELFNGQWNTPAFLKLLREALDQNESFTGFEVALNLPLLGARMLLVNGYRLIQPEVQPPLLLLQIADITDSRRMEMELRQAQKMEAIGHLAAGVAHDFNNLLTVINGYCSVLEDRLVADAKTREMVSKIGQAGESAANLTRQLLAFSRKSMLAPRILDLNALAVKMETMLNRVLGENIHLKTIKEPGLARILADPALIEQVILNLAINARDAMPYGGNLTIEVRSVDCDQTFKMQHPEVALGPYMLLTVRDTGSGMNEEAVARVFEPFFTTKEVGKGTGLGLASVYGSVKQSGGVVYVNSQTGQGTEFSIYLPRLPDLPENGEAPVTLGPIPKGRETLLLVEDSSEVRALASMVLNEAGYTVLKAEDGVHALAVAQMHATPIDLLVTDLVMPNMGGRQLADRLMSTHPNVKVLYLSGYADERVGRGSVEHDAVTFLQKPYTPSDLARRVREVLDSK